MLNLSEIKDDLKIKESNLNNISKSLINILYKKLMSSDKNLNSIEKEWKKEFKFIYGDIENDISSNKKIKSDKLIEFFKLNVDKDLDINKLFFSIQTYFTLFIKIITFEIVKDLNQDKNEIIYNKEYIQNILNGMLFEKCGIKNYCYEDLFCWVENYWDEDIESCLLELIEEIEIYKNIESINDFIKMHNNDYIKEIYETIIPKELRHALGEYYTPDWLAEYTINETIKYSDKSQPYVKVLDPTCGSGTFIFKYIQNLKTTTTNPNIIINNVKGLDINPIAVLTAKTNYLISIIHLLSKDNKISIPIYNYDVINSPSLISNRTLQVDLNINGIFKIPFIYTDMENFYNIKKIIKNSIYNNNTLDEFKIELIKYNTSDLYEDLIEYSNSNENICDLYKKLISYDNKLISFSILNTIENRINGYKLKDFDIILGNPPWINWEYLSKEYRVKSQHLWPEYGIFSAKGKDLSFSKEDICVLITYIVIDKFLKDKGQLGFVIKQGLFKSAQNGIGFRKFTVRDGEYDIKVNKVDDLSNIKAFENASTSTAIMFLQKGMKTHYPLPYNTWKLCKGRKRGKLGTYSDLDDILNQVDINEMIAMPSIKNDITSLWITGYKEALEAVDNILGENRYKARTGLFTGGANAVYWVDIIKKLDNGNVVVRNITERAKRKVENVEVEIEQDLIYPLVKGSSISKWKIDSDIYIICPHTKMTKMKPIDKIEMEKNYPLTYKYLTRFRQELDERKGFVGWEKENQKENFHTILRIGEYTFSKYKVVWKYISSEFIVSVISSIEDKYMGEKMLMPNEKVMYISTDNELEAYYLCGILSSSPISYCVKSYMNPTSISAHILEKLNIPEYCPDNRIHNEIANLCKYGHDSNITQEQKNDIQDKIDTLVGLLYKIDKEKINLVRKVLIM